MTTSILSSRILHPPLRSRHEQAGRLRLPSLCSPLIHSLGGAEDEVNPLSPDGLWRYQLVDDHSPENCKTRAAKRALDLR